MASDILVVDDETDIRELISGILEDEGHSTRLAKDSDETLQAIEERRPSLVILYIWLQGSKLDGLELLDRIKKAHPDLPVIIISGHGNIETAVAAIKRGAYDYIEKPFKADRLVLLTTRALEASRLKRENRELRERSSYSFEMIGRSAAINQLRQAIDKVAPTNSRVLITGPSGCGKELAARVMHAKSARAEGPFVVLNAAASTISRAEDEDPEAFMDVLQVNVGAQSALAAAAARAMIAAGTGGWMILMSSILGRKAGTGPGVAAYVASKIAVEGLTRELARQWAPHGIRVNALAPGYFPTEMNAPMTRDPGRRDALLGRTPMGRSGEPEDLVGPALFLASGASRFVTGHVLPVDGGMACW